MTGRTWIGALTLLATLMSTSSYGSGPFVESRALGIVMTRTQSSVMINGAPAMSGTTVFRGDVLQTPKASTALVKLRSGSSLAISENSEVALDLANPTAVAEKVDLHRGAINLRNPSQQPEMVTLSGASILVRGEGSFPAICRIALVGQSSAIINDRGHVEIRGSGSPMILPIGQYATLEAGRPQGGSQSAGTVTKEIPSETVQHTGQTPSPLKLQDAVYWGDDVQTQNNGRVQITLQDNSTLNIGPRADMKIVKHDAQSQQTAIELTAGKVRSQVQKITQQTGSFQVTTQTAVIGVVGTDFVVEADKKKKKTMVWCIDGEVRVRNINAAIVGVLILHAGEFTTIAFGLAPAAATPLTPAMMQTQLGATNAGTGVSGGAGGVGLGAHAALVGAIGTSAGAGVGAGVADRRSTSTTGELGTATTVLGGATADSNSANSNSGAAQAAANGANQSTGDANGILTGIIQTFTSPTYPCGCH